MTLNSYMRACSPLFSQTWLGVATGSATVPPLCSASAPLCSIVGASDGGVLLSEAEYAAFKARAIEARKNRIYVCWRQLESQMDCKNIGPESKCACAWHTCTPSCTPHA